MNRNFIYLALTALFFISAPACAEKQPVTELEKFSYTVGVQIAQNLMRQGIQVQTDAMVQAVSDVLDGKDLKLSGQEMQEVMASYQQQQTQAQNALASANKTTGEKFLAENKTKAGVIALPSGLQYKIVTAGSGAKPKAADTVTVHYEGRLIDGSIFDSSYKRGEPATFPVNGVIQGWQDILQIMPVGSRWQVYIPSELAYGERGAGADIGPNAILIFDIELISIN